MKLEVNYFKATSGKWKHTKSFTIPQQYINDMYIVKGNIEAMTKLNYAFRVWAEVTIADDELIAVPDVNDSPIIEELFGFPMMVMPG